MPAFQLRTAIERQVKDGPKDLDVLAWMGRTALELVGQGMMGYSFDPLTEEVHNDFAEAVKSFMCVSFVPSSATSRIHLTLIFHTDRRFLPSSG